MDSNVWDEARVCGEFAVYVWAPKVKKQFSLSSSLVILLHLKRAFAFRALN